MGISDLETLASRVIRQCVNTQKGENVLIEAIDLDDLTLPELLAVECVKVGAYPILLVRPQSVLHSKLLGWGHEELEYVPAHDLGVYSNLDIRVSVYSSFWPMWWHEISEVKKGSIDKSYQVILEALPRKNFRNLQIPCRQKEHAKKKIWIMTKYTKSSYQVSMWITWRCRNLPPS